MVQFRVANCAACGSVVTITTVFPKSEALRGWFPHFLRRRGIQLPVGSSARISAGSVTMARAIATRCS
jgi:hypothetical protein